MSSMDPWLCIGLATNQDSHWLDPEWILEAVWWSVLFNSNTNWNCFVANNDVVSWKVNGDHWIVNPAWIKNAGQGSRTLPHPVPIPTSFNKYIRFYLDCIRSSLMKEMTDAFWINSKGAPMSSDCCREYIKHVIEKTTQKKLTIRLLRLNINSHFFDSGPHNPQDQLWWNYLMDHSAETEREHYRVWETEKWSHDCTGVHSFLVKCLLFFLKLTLQFRRRWVSQNQIQEAKKRERCEFFLSGREGWSFLQFKILFLCWLKTIQEKKINSSFPRIQLIKFLFETWSNRFDQPLSHHQPITTKHLENQRSTYDNSSFPWSLLFMEQ